MRFSNTIRSLGLGDCDFDDRHGAVAYRSSGGVDELD